MSHHLIGTTILVSVALASVEPTLAHADDAIDEILRHGHVPSGMMHEHGYSDFTDPLNRFLDLLAAGAFAEARAIQPDACATWLATRQNTPLTGKVRMWDTEINLDALCARR